MTITGLSEFTFGFAFLFEQTHQHWPGLKAAPVLPSLRQEADDAWDAHLPLVAADYYYQFKLSDYLFNWNAKYILDTTYTAPYYRIALHPRDNNRQHRRLRRHCQNFEHTYYVAPEVETLDDFNTSFLSKQLTQNSRLIKLSDCDDIGLKDGTQHYITYQPGNPAWIQHSEPKRHERSAFGKELESVYNESRPTWKAVDRAFARSLFENASDAVNRSLLEEGDWKRRSPATDREKELVSGMLAPPNDEATRVQLILRTADLVSVFFGLTLVLVGSPTEAEPAEA